MLGHSFRALSVLQFSELGVRKVLIGGDRMGTRLLVQLQQFLISVELENQLITDLPASLAETFLKIKQSIRAQCREALSAETPSTSKLKSEVA